MTYGIAYNNSTLCKYFREAVLPLKPELETIFSKIAETKPCKICGEGFIPVGRRTYCSEKCRAKSNRMANVARVRKHRRNKHENVMK